MIMLSWYDYVPKELITGSRMLVIKGAGAFSQADGRPHWVEQLRVTDLSVGTYSVPAGGLDGQLPHSEDEIYVITRGHGTLEAGGDRAAVGPGSVLYVPAGEAHRFTDVVEDLAAVVLFAPAEESRFVPHYVATFNSAVTSGDYAPLVARFADAAVLRFENVPPRSVTLEFTGRAAIAAAYEQNPPDDQIDLAGEARAEGGHVVVPFAWRRDGSPGVLDFALTDGLVSSLTVSFGQLG